MPKCQIPVKHFLLGLCEITNICLQFYEFEFQWLLPDVTIFIFIWMGCFSHFNSLFTYTYFKHSPLILLCLTCHFRDFLFCLDAHCMCFIFSFLHNYMWVPTHHFDTLKFARLSSSRRARDLLSKIYVDVGGDVGYTWGVGLSLWDNY